jgi:DNA-binding transcriptional LysR family regulator
MTKSVGTPSLDQLQVFLTVVEADGFAAAARRLKRAPSAVSYAIAQLEAQLGLPVFDRSSTKRPLLTEAGQAVLAEARTVARSVDGLRARVGGLLNGLEAEVGLVVDVMLPTARLVDALQGFQAAFPTVTLRLHVEALGAVTQLVLDRVAGIGVSGPLDLAIEVDSLRRRPVGEVSLIPVAAPFHPLAQRGVVGPGMTDEHVQLVLSDRSKLTEGRDFGVFGVNTWRLADLGAKHALLLAGVGWGNMPEFLVRDDLAAGRLVSLELTEWAGGDYGLHVLHRADTPPGPAARWLIERFAEQAPA